MSDDFSWQPTNRRRYAFPILAGLVVGFSALTGFAIGNRYPLSHVVEAIEHNGVVRQDVDRIAAPLTTVPSDTKAIAHPSQEPDVPKPPSPPSAPSPPPLLLNPSTAELVKVPDIRAEQPRTASRTIRVPIRSAQKQGQKVLVVVRRVGPPYDTKILRGQMRGGRLLVDQRDRRGIIIR